MGQFEGGADGSADFVSADLRVAGGFRAYFAVRVQRDGVRVRDCEEWSALLDHLGQFAELLGRELHDGESVGSIAVGAFSGYDEWEYAGGSYGIDGCGGDQAG